jgi:predicted nucleotidyltransferase component of viral defense system
MKDRIQALVNQRQTAVESGLIVREYLQARILESLQRSAAFQSWAFLGGTALRFLYGLPRFSEDLDFSRLEAFEPEMYVRDEFDRLVGGVRRAFEAEAYDVDVRLNAESVVQSALLGFPGLMFELGLSSQRGQKISIKIEVDTNPPPYAETQTSVVRRHVLLNLLHYDRPSLLAGKLHALIHRSHVKGRDVYDLLWYLSDPDWPEPNPRLLQASLRQTGMELSDGEVEDWRGLVRTRLKEIKWDRVVADVSPFLERREDIDLLTRENLLSLLGRR